MADIATLVRRIFRIPVWYEMSDFEQEKLYKYIKEASCPQEARLYRMLDCSAFCVEEKCFFCGEFARRRV